MTAEEARALTIERNYAQIMQEIDKGTHSPRFYGTVYTDILPVNRQRLESEGYVLHTENRTNTLVSWKEGDGEG